MLLHYSNCNFILIYIRMIVAKKVIITYNLVIYNPLFIVFSAILVMTSQLQLVEEARVSGKKHCLTPSH